MPRIGSTGIVENRPQEIVSQWRMVPLFILGHNFAGAGTFEFFPVHSDVNVLYITVNETIASGANHTVSVTVDGVTYNSLATALVAATVYYVYLPADSDTLVITNVQTLAGDGRPWFGGSFSISETVTAAAAGDVVTVRYQQL